MVEILFDLNFKGWVGYIQPESVVNALAGRESGKKHEENNALEILER